ELLGVARFSFCVCRQVLSALFLDPASGGGEAVVREVVCLRHRQDPTGAVKRLFNERRSRFAEAPLELFAPDLRRRIRVISQRTEDLEEMPVPLKLPVVISVLRP